MASASSSSSSAAAADKPTQSLLRQRFNDRREALVGEERDTTVFNIKKPRHNLMLTSSTDGMSGAAAHWGAGEATRELTTNFEDECRKAARECGKDPDALVFSVRRPTDAGDAAVKMVLTPGAPGVMVDVVWECTATLCGVAVGEIRFVYETGTGYTHGLWRNHFTCFNVLKVFGNGFTTKTGDDTQSGRFGDGLKSATAVLTREAEMQLLTAGRLFDFVYVTEGAHGWLMMQKAKIQTVSGRLVGRDLKDTLFKITWKTGKRVEDVFAPLNYLSFAEEPLDEMRLTPDGSERLVFNKKYRGKLFVYNNFVCDVYEFSDFAYVSARLKKAMNRDRSSIDSWDARRSLAKSVAAYLAAGNDPARIYDMINDANGRGSAAFADLTEMGDKNWKTCLAAEFRKRNGTAYPYECGMVGDRALIERELDLEAVAVSGTLYKILCSSGAFRTVDAEVTVAFSTRGRAVEWPEGSRVRATIAGMVAALHEMHGCRDATIDVRLRDVKSKFSVRIAMDAAEDVKGWHQSLRSGKDATVYLRWSAVRALEAADAKPADIRSILYAIYEAMTENYLARLDRADDRRFCLRIANFAEGRFDEDPIVSDAEDGGGGDADAGESRKRGAGNAFTANDAIGNVGGDDARPAKRPRDASWVQRKFGDIGAPAPVGVTRSPISAARGSASAPKPKPKPKPSTREMDHGCEGELVPYQGFAGDEYGAVFYKSSAWDFAPTKAAYTTAAHVVRNLLRGVFDWSDAITFGVYSENSDTIAFTRNGTELFVNAFYALSNTDADTTWFYFSVLCHEMTHILGYGDHDTDFATAMTEVTMKYQPKLVSYLMAEHVGRDCTADCLIDNKCLCYRHAHDRRDDDDDA